MAGVSNFPTRLVPLKGTEANRASKAGSILTGELHTTTDTARLFLQNAPINAVFHGAVANTAARIALNSSSSRGAWAGDLCYQTDVAGLYICVTSPGTSDGHWTKIAELASGLTAATGDILYRNSGGVLVPLTAGTNGYVLKLSAGLPIWAAESGGGGGGSTLLVDAYPSSNITLNVTSTWTDIVYNTAPTNDATQYNTSTGVWTVPSTGEYDITFQLKFYNVSTGVCQVRIYNNTTPASLAIATQRAGDINGCSPVIRKRLTLTSGDSVKFQYNKVASGSGQSFSGADYQFLQIVGL
jgi:hypothetical protein